MTPAELIEQIASSIGVQAVIVTTGDQLHSDDETQEDLTWLQPPSETHGMSHLLAALVHPERVEGWDAYEAALGMGAGDLTDAAYGQLDLGTRCMVSGGEVVELGTQEGNDTEIPF